MAKSVKKATDATTAAAKPRKAAAKKEAAPANGASSTISPEQIAELAHKFWAERGHKHGHHEEDWLRAEKELRGKAS
jgi:hypothetical protein